MKKELCFILSFFLLVSCSTNNQSETVKNYYYNDYLDITIPLINMYEVNSSSYGVYFFSRYCPSCNDLSTYLFSYLNNKEKVLDIYLVNLNNVNEETYNLLLRPNNMSDEEIIANTIGASTINTTYFKTAPCLYLINDNNVIDVYLTYPSCYDLFTSNKLK